MCSAQKSQSNEDQEKVSIYSPFHSFNEMKPQKGKLLEELDCKVVDQLLTLSWREEFGPSTQSFEVGWIGGEERSNQLSDLKTLNYYYQQEDQKEQEDDNGSQFQQKKEEQNINKGEEEEQQTEKSKCFEKSVNFVKQIYQFNHLRKLGTKREDKIQSPKSDSISKISQLDKNYNKTNISSSPSHFVRIEEIIQQSNTQNGERSFKRQSLHDQYQATLEYYSQQQCSQTDLPPDEQQVTPLRSKIKIKKQNFVLNQKNEPTFSYQYPIIKSDEQEEESQTQERVKMYSYIPRTSKQVYRSLESRNRDHQNLNLNLKNNNKLTYNQYQTSKKELESEEDIRSAPKLEAKQRNNNNNNNNFVIYSFPKNSQIKCQQNQTFTSSFSSKLNKSQPMKKLRKRDGSQNNNNIESPKYQEYVESFLRTQEFNQILTVNSQKGSFQQATDPNILREVKSIRRINYSRLSTKPSSPYQSFNRKIPNQTEQDESLSQIKNIASSSSKRFSKQISAKEIKFPQIEGKR